MRSRCGRGDIDGARQLLQAGIKAFPLLPLRIPVLAKLGPTLTWALLAILVFTPFLGGLIWTQADFWLYGALGAAALGIFFCNWGSIYGLQALLASSEAFESVLEGEREEIRRVFLSRFCGSCSLSKTVLGGAVIGAVITGALLLQNFSASESAFSRSFAGAHYILIFLSAFGIGVGHVCIFCMLRLVLVVRQFGFRKLHSVVRIYDLSRGYLQLASICLVVYINYLAYLYFMWLGGSRFSLPVNTLTAAVGAIVLVVYIYPQLVIHAALKRNRSLLVEEAISHLEKITAKPGQTSREHQEEIIKALEYLTCMEATPTWGFQLKELAAVFIGYAVPLFSFLEAQGNRLRSLL